MNNSEHLEKSIEEFYGIHPFTKMVKFIVGPFGGFAPIMDYTIDEFDKKKEDKIPSGLIERVSEISNVSFVSSKLEYSKVRKGYVNSKDIPTPRWMFVGLYSKKLGEYHKRCEDFEEFVNLWESSKKKD